MFLSLTTGWLAPPLISIYVAADEVFFVLRFELLTQIGYLMPTVDKIIIIIVQLKNNCKGSHEQGTHYSRSGSQSTLGNVLFPVLKKNTNLPTFIII